MFELQKAIIPAPRHIKDNGAEVKIGTIMGINVSVISGYDGKVLSASKQYIENKLFKNSPVVSDDDSYKIELIISSDEKLFTDGNNPESYIVDITSERARLIGFTEAAVYWAAVSFGALIHTESENVLIPECYIYDYPRFSKRGHFMECRYGSDFMTLNDWKKALDYLSEMKINTITLGLYGCWSRQYDGVFAEYQYVPLKKYPNLKTPRNIKYYSAKRKEIVYKKDVLPVMYTEDYFGEMIAYAAKKNIEVIPLFNSYGHNTLIPRLYPEISARFEDGTPSGVGLCTNNPKTYEIFFDIYDEIIDRYLKPNGITSFEIGLDEVVSVQGYDLNNIYEWRKAFCSCEKCKGKGKSDLVIEYIINVVKYLKQKGMKSVYIYYDMLFEAGVLNEDLANLFKKEGIYDVVVMDWWSYASRANIYNGHREQVNSHFRSVGKPITGYFHWNMPTQMNEDVYAVTEVADEQNFEGIIGYSSFEYCYDYNYWLFAECAWNGKNYIPEKEMLSAYAKVTFPEDVKGASEAIELANEFMLGRYIKADNYCEQIFDYYNTSYLRKDLPYPQDYPAKQFRFIRDDEEKYLPYLKSVLEKSEKVYNYFNSNTSSTTGDIWKLIALTYKALSDEFLTIYNIVGLYNNGMVESDNVINELERLICQREHLISLCEDVRIEANQYTHIRNMSIIRQFMIDLLEFVKDGVSKGEKPEIDLFKFDQYLGEISKFYR